MIKTLQKFSYVLLIGITLSTLTGCVALVVGAAAGAGGVAYVSGVLTKNLDTPLEKLHHASLDALKRLKMTINEEKIEGSTSYIKAHDVDRAKVKVTIEKLTENSSKLNVRVGFFGNQTKSQLILNAIQKRL